jgi:hypothetical protein
MNSLIRRILAVSFIVFFGFASIAAQEPELPPLTVDELLQVVDLNIGLKDIHQAILSGEDVPIDRYYLITRHGNRHYHHRSRSAVLPLRGGPPDRRVGRR